MRPSVLTFTRSLDHSYGLNCVLHTDGMVGHGILGMPLSYHFEYYPPVILKSMHFIFAAT